MQKCLLLFVFFLLTQSPYLHASYGYEMYIPDKAKANIVNHQGQGVGKAAVKEIHEEMYLDLSIDKLPSGEYSFQIHDTGNCTPPDFESAGDVFQAAAGAATADEYQLMVREDGTGEMIVPVSHVQLKPGDHSLFKAGGTSIIIYEGSFEGARVACGVFAS